MIALNGIDSWQAGDGSVTTWMASQATRDIALRARRNPLPPSFQEAQHLRAAFYGQALGRPQPRLMVTAWDIPGTCDMKAMTAAVNAHVRRHDTYHSAFEFENGNIVRRTIENPDDIEFAPVSFGHMNAAQIRRHALTTTPATLEWDCFSFGVIQQKDHFTFYASTDHLHIDGVSAGLIFLDIHLMYQDLALPEAGSYREYTVGQREKVAGLTLSSPEIKDWIRFAQNTNGDWPSFPLPLGDTWAGPKGDFVTVELLDGDDTETFETACHAAGARFSGGVLACAALAEHRLTGRDTYHGFTPIDTRARGVDTMSVGWFAGLCPVTVPTGSGRFSDAARAAQESFDASKHLAKVPMERVMELAPLDALGIKPPTRPGMMVSFLDFRKIPCASLWEQTNFGIYGDDLSHGGINMWINRGAANTTVTVSFPDNAVARESVRRYTEVLRAVFAAAVSTATDWVDEVALHANSSHVY